MAPLVVRASFAVGYGLRAPVLERILIAVFLGKLVKILLHINWFTSDHVRMTDWSGLLVLVLVDFFVGFDRRVVAFEFRRLFIVRVNFCLTNIIIGFGFE